MELERFRDKNVLLLQGPVGPFFARLAQDLRSVGAKVFKVNFNGGDWLFYPRGALQYRGRPEDWPAWLEDLMRRERIDVVQVFGDCRPIHKAALAVAAKCGIDSWVFEEGYLRPDYITFERSGVNAYSLLPRKPARYAVAPPAPKMVPVGNAYWFMVRCCFLYCLAANLAMPWFRHYRHHRRIGALETLPWIRSLWRKLWYRWSERGAQERLTGPWSQSYFLVPLQVFNDAQVTEHASFDDIEQFIASTLLSFVKHAPGETRLVFKHHPMDRGYRDYSALIARLAREAGISPRVHYIHDQYLPGLLRHARGVVVINSSAGLSALHHGAPTKVCGKALYDVEGLTYQGELDHFWHAAPEAKPDAKLYRRFRDHLVARTQINGSFYKRLKAAQAATGLVWSVPSPRELSRAEEGGGQNQPERVAAHA